VGGAGGVKKRVGAVFGGKKPPPHKV